MHDLFSDILNRYRAGDCELEEAREALQQLQAQPLGFATIDHDRNRRCGAAEVIYAAGKQPEQVVTIARHLLEQNHAVLITRAGPAHVERLRSELVDVPFELGSRGSTVVLGTPRMDDTLASIPIITAGTSDLPVAEEAMLTCRWFGQPSRMIHDIGVAGVHRIGRYLPELKQACVVVCIAGMEGALPSVIGGLVDVPVIAVPTSIGYGAAFQGVAALLGMLTSCASGVSVVNIDNGFGAAYTACLINRLAGRSET